MKLIKSLPFCFALSLSLLLGGCLNLQLGSGPSARPPAATVGQQLLDLQRARNTGAISEAEYQDQKAKILEKK